jgi:hypothetical protein
MVGVGLKATRASTIANEVKKNLIEHPSSTCIHRPLGRGALSRRQRGIGPCHSKANKKADVVEHPKAFDHVGLLVNKPPG